MCSFVPRRRTRPPRLAALPSAARGTGVTTPAFLEACRAELTIHPRQCDGVRLIVAERAGTVLGFYRLAGHPPHGELADLFVEPTAVGQGVGGHLLRHATEVSRQLGFELLSIDADPNAEAFYLNAGAIRTGDVASASISDRRLPRLELSVLPPD